MPELPYEPEANVWEDFGEPNPVVVYTTVRKDLLKERIETKIEEIRESQRGYDLFSTAGKVAHLGDSGVIQGLELALQILEES